MEDNKIYLFKPHGNRDIRRLYPELNDINEFKGLTSREMLFVWYYGNRTSEYFIWSKGDIDKSRACYEKAFTGVNSKQKQDYESGKIPDKIKKAIRRMSEFDVTPRSKAKYMVNKILERFNETINIGEEHFISDGYIDIGRKKAYIDACSKIAEKLPELISQIESGYGITIDDEADVSNDMNAIEYFHSNLKD